MSGGEGFSRHEAYKVSFWVALALLVMCPSEASFKLGGDKGAQKSFKKFPLSPSRSISDLRALPGALSPSAPQPPEALAAQPLLPSLPSPPSNETLGPQPSSLSTSASDSELGLEKSALILLKPSTFEEDVMSKRVAELEKELEVSKAALTLSRQTTATLIAGDKKEREERMLLEAHSNSLKEELDTSKALLSLKTRQLQALEEEKRLMLLTFQELESDFSGNPDKRQHLEPQKQTEEPRVGLKKEEPSAPQPLSPLATDPEDSFMAKIERFDNLLRGVLAQKANKFMSLAIECAQEEAGALLELDTQPSAHHGLLETENPAAHHLSTSVLNPSIPHSSYEKGLVLPPSAPQPLTPSAPTKHFGAPPDKLKACQGELAACRLWSHILSSQLKQVHKADPQDSTPQPNEVWTGALTLESNVTLILSLSPSAAQPSDDDVVELKGRLFYAKRGKSSTIKGTSRGYEIGLEEFFDDDESAQPLSPSILRLVRVGKMMEGIWIHQDRGVWGHVKFSLLTVPQPAAPQPPSPPPVAGHISGSPANTMIKGKRMLDLLFSTPQHLNQPSPQETDDPEAITVPATQGPTKSPAPSSAPTSPTRTQPTKLQHAAAQTVSSADPHCDSNPNTYPAKELSTSVPQPPSTNKSSALISAPTSVRKAPRRSAGTARQASDQTASRNSNKSGAAKRSSLHSCGRSASQQATRSAPYFPHDKELQPVPQRAIRAKRRRSRPAWEAASHSVKQATECPVNEVKRPQEVRADGPSGFILQNPGPRQSSELSTLRDRTLKARRAQEGPNWAWVDNEEATLTVRLDVLAIVVAIFGSVLAWILIRLNRLGPSPATAQPLERLDADKGRKQNMADSQAPAPSSLCSSTSQEIPLESFKAFSQVFAESQASLSSSALQPLSLSTSASTSASTLNPSRRETKPSPKSNDRGAENPNPSASDFEGSSPLEPSGFTVTSWGPESSGASSLTPSTLVPKPSSSFQRVDLVREPEAESLMDSSEPQTMDDLVDHPLCTSREQRISDGWMAVGDALQASALTSDSLTSSHESCQ